MSIGDLMATVWLGSLSYSHYGYSRRAAAARALPDGVKARPGRIYFVSYPENKLALDIGGWHPNVGHASLLTRDEAGQVTQYDYGWFVGRGGGRPDEAIGYADESPSYGVVTRRAFSGKQTNDMEIARMVLNGMSSDYGDRIELWTKDVGDIGIAERYMEQFAADENRGSLLQGIFPTLGSKLASLVAQTVKNLPAVQERGWEDPMEEGGHGYG